jgi:hypothetical protein
MSKINNTKIINGIEQQQQKAMPLDLDNSQKPSILPTVQSLK